MLVEGFVAVTALVAASALQPGDYFALNIAQDPAKPLQVTKYNEFIATAAATHNWNLAPQELPALEQQTEEKLVGRVGGAVTLAVGMANVFTSLPGMKHLMSYWYHFAIMFEALFILTLLETGTRVARFVVQDIATQMRPAEAAPTGKPNWSMNVIMSVVACAGWGALLYLGDLTTLWGMLGISNQLLAAIALAVGTTYLLLHAPRRVYALCTGIPFVFVVTTIFVASLMRVDMWWDAIPKTPDPRQRFLLQLVCVLVVIMLALTTLITFGAVRRWYQLLNGAPRVAAATP